VKSNDGETALLYAFPARFWLGVSSSISIDVKAGKIVIEASPKAPCKVNLPFSEADLLKGLDAHGAHADEIALPSATEMSV